MKYLKMFYAKNGLPFLIIPLIVTIIGSCSVWSNWFLKEVMDIARMPTEARLIICVAFIGMFLLYNLRNWLLVRTDIEMTKKYGPGWRKYVE